VNFHKKEAHPPLITYSNYRETCLRLRSAILYKEWNSIETLISIVVLLFAEAI